MMAWEGEGGGNGTTLRVFVLRSLAFTLAFLFVLGSFHQVRSAEAKATRLEQAAMAGQRYRVQAEALRMDAQHWDSEFRSILRDLGKLTTETEGHGGAGSAAKPAAAASRVTPERVLQVLQDLRMERAVMLRAQGIADANTASARREAAASASRIVDLESELAEAQVG